MSIISNNEENCYTITKFLEFFNLILIFILITKWSVWFPFASLVFTHLVLTTILSFIYSLILKSEQQNNGLDIHNDIESDTNSVDIPTVLLPNEALPTETTNLRDSPPSYTDVGPPPNYEDVVKDLKVSNF
jgi:hypothetical protein